MAAHSRWSRKFSRTTARLAAEIGRSNPLTTANAASPMVTKQDKSSQSLPASPFGFSPSSHGMEGDIDRATNSAVRAAAQPLASNGQATLSAPSGGEGAVSLSHGAASRASTPRVEPIAPRGLLFTGNDEVSLLLRSPWPSIDLRSLSFGVSDRQQTGEQTGCLSQNPGNFG